MEFSYKSNGIDIKFEETDSLTEKRIVEQAIGLLNTILTTLREAKEAH
jgi:hypothetical protein